ncbi:MAG: hypothetical protein K2W96_20190 [Gemmataceae bacterium]|nr:hypothetical protein [Gemmataceae bacterium]
MEAWGRWLRSVPGQLSLLGFAFAGSAALALLPWLLRERVFVHYAREAYPKHEDTYAETALKTLTRGGATAEEIDNVLVEIRRRDDTEGKERFQNLERMYGRWMLDPDVREGGRLARRLTGSGRRWLREWTIQRLRTTLAAGNVDQRSGAVAWIAAALEAEELPDREELRRLLEQARDRARRRGEDTLADQAAAALKGRG